MRLAWHNPPKLARTPVYIALIHLEDQQEELAQFE